ncbi:hypothetical protein Kpol_1067p4 [Vanderwaltozyma polyspora DSM 70294]|uniref:Mitochondrial carrier protein MTM1 n=1 Tax=Vanderwaltozyma polyspora (strain ATCC 22028 / DSM 70294 / BCRC 21397 / CBS 2163 / NBRC 10782 / NRRL Y-8283 / UCD 57-17) TaxID=436907 RepID=A7TNU9_VANPO|nr:uncharacterized protein Kpol_1067p4 [Vanderwaltozyma polyspora DSM 70294]EDO16032.1 hypothetical protein Kpol_1067p4 [Vanderwaltozyma polyspora DSM 70294]
MPGEVTLTLSERMASAVSGSLITSLILTPMDVVRIRLQQQELLPDCSCDGGKTGRQAVSSFVKHSSDHAIFWQTFCFQDINCKNTSIRYSGTLEAMRNIAHVEGIHSLWRGLSLTLFMAIPANIVYFTGYEYIRDISPLKSSLPTFNPVICGALARVIAASSVAPLELLKTRLQSIPTSSKNTKSLLLIKDLLKETRNEVQSTGYKALFKGLEITLWRDVPFSAIYWGTYEFCKRNLMIKDSSSSNIFHFMNSFIHGTISGTIAALITHPFDVGKTRLQISLVNNDNNTLTKVEKPSKNLFRFLNNIKKNEGIRALYAGLMPRIFKIAPSCAIMISTYELSKRIFDK